MNRLHLAAVAAAALATAAHAQQYAWSISDTGDGDGVIEPGETALIDLELAWGPPGIALSWSHFDVLGIQGWSEGEVLDADNWDCAVLSGAPIVADNNDILEIDNAQLPCMWNCECGCGDWTNPTPQLHLEWRASSYFHREVTIEPTNFHLDDDDNIINLFIDCWGVTISLEPVTEPFTFTVHCPADVIQDGQLDSRDVIAFLNLFAARDPAADFNESGAVDTRDFIAFLNAWAAGC